MFNLTNRTKLTSLFLKIINTASQTYRIVFFQLMRTGKTGQEVVWRYMSDKMEMKNKLCCFCIQGIPLIVPFKGCKSGSVKRHEIIQRSFYLSTNHAKCSLKMKSKKKFPPNT